jgi:hypothetical protein
LAFAALAGALIVMTAEGTSQFSRSIRRERESAALRQLIGSGSAWVQVHGDRLRAGQAVVLDASTLLDKQPTATVTLRSQSAPGAIRPMVEITASLIRNGRRVSRTARIDLPTAPR